jgi:hypothetical protein
VSSREISGETDEWREFCTEMNANGFRLASDGTFVKRSATGVMHARPPTRVERYGWHPRSFDVSLLGGSTYPLSELARPAR